MNHRLHIGNLSADTTTASLIEAFQRDGRTVVRAQLVMSRTPGRSRGFAFVDMATGEEAGAAIAALNGTDIEGRTVRVSHAHEPKSRFGGTVGGPQAAPVNGKP